MSIEKYSNSITHHGIKGQRWGVRRYQNEDGTLTAAGRKRAEKKEIKMDAKQLAKAGIPGGLKDRLNKNRGTELYSKINQERGKKYTNKVLKSAKMRTYGQAAAATSIGVAAATIAGMGLATIKLKSNLNYLNSVY